MTSARLPYPEFDQCRGTASVHLLSELAQQQGMSFAQCLDKTGLSEADLHASDLEIRAGQELQLIENMLQYCDHDFALGITAGLGYHISSYGTWGFAMISCPTLRSAIELGLRYLDLTFAFTHITMQEHGDEVSLQVDAGHLPEHLQAFLIARDMLAIQTIQHELLLSPIPVCSVCLSLSEAPGKELIESTLGIEIELNQSANRISFSRNYLDLPLPQGNPATVALFEQQCQQLLDARFSNAGIASQLRQRLMMNSRNIPSMAQLAEELAMGERTLRRKLSAEGTSWRQLLDDVRCTLAEELLLAGMSVEEVAERLAYSEVSNFTHAFKRWKGVPPSGFRRRQSN